MALQTSGQITLKDIATEFEDTAPHTLKEFYSAAGGVPASGEITLKDFYGTSNLITLTVLLVAGGGGGGAHFDNDRRGGHGGAGGVLNGTMQVLPGTFAFTIGSKGAYRSKGGNSTFNGATAIGGGYGGDGSESASTRAGGAGGSGGGGSEGWSLAGGAAQQTDSAGLTGYGNAGGNAIDTSVSGGGGGAGGAGTAGTGGASKSFTIGGTAYDVARGGPQGSGTGYGDGSDRETSNGGNGVLIVSGPNNTVVKTVSGNLTVASDGTLS